MTGAPDLPYSCWDCASFAPSGRSAGCDRPFQTCKRRKLQVSFWNAAERLVIRPASGECAEFQLAALRS